MGGYEFILGDCTMKGSISLHGVTLLRMDRDTLHLLGRRHAVAVLSYLSGKTDGAILNDIDYDAVRSHPSARDIVKALKGAGLIERDGDLRYHISESGRGALAFAQAEAPQIVVPASKSRAISTGK
jgi:hypothetical protein